MSALRVNIFVETVSVGEQTAANHAALYQMMFGMRPRVTHAVVVAVPTHAINRVSVHVCLEASHVNVSPL